MLRPPSNQKPYDEFYSRDPAFVQPPPELAAGVELDAELVKAHKAEVAAHAERVRIARETGDYKPLLAGELRPTLFTMAPLSGDVFRKLCDLVTGGTIRGFALDQLALRCALVGVVNLDDHTVERKLHDNARLHELGAMATVDIPNLLDSIDRRIVGELGGLVMKKARGPDPK